MPWGGGIGWHGHGLESLVGMALVWARFLEGNAPERAPPVLLMHVERSPPWSDRYPVAGRRQARLRLCAAAGVFLDDPLGPGYRHAPRALGAPPRRGQPGAVRSRHQQRRRKLGAFLIGRYERPVTEPHYTVAVSQPNPAFCRQIRALSSVTQDYPISSTLVAARVLLFVFPPNPAIRRKQNFGQKFAKFW